MQFSLDSSFHLHPLHFLTLGGDSRTHQPYGLSVPAPDGFCSLGSCTANPIDSAMLDRLASLRSDADPSSDLRDLFGASRAQLLASGTDTEHAIALSMGPQPYASLLIDPSEVGSGTLPAAQGLPHAPGSPLRDPLPVHATPIILPLRDPEGSLLSQAQIDQRAFDAVAQAVSDFNGRVLLHFVACSKTGLSAPSESACRSIQRAFPSIRVVVDAAQGRWLAGDVQRWLSFGWAVMITGSKYWGAPPFCGAVLFPSSWTPSADPMLLPQGACLGLRARWLIALDRMRQLGGSLAHLSAWNASLESHWMPLASRFPVDASFSRSPGSILAFDAGLDFERSTLLHRRLIARGVFLGQPVRAGSRALLRVALGSGMDRSSMEQSLHRAAQALLSELRHG